MRVNFDQAATTRPSKHVLDAITPYLTTIYGNPNSTHSLGKQSREAIEKARADIADILRGEVENVYFTNSVTTANNIAIQGYMKSHPSVHILCSAVEHVDIIECVQSYNSYILPVDSNGLINMSSYQEFCQHAPANSLVIVQYVNNETGCIQPICKLADIAHRYNHVLMCDATQAIGYEIVNIRHLHVDIFTFGAHKIGGIRGAAVLYSSIPLRTIIHGHQEKGLVGGTENTAAIVGLSVALKDIVCQPRHYMRDLHDYFVDCVSRIPYAHVVLNENVSPHIVNVQFDGCDGNTIVSMLDNIGICASTGSACNSNVLEKSYVLEAIGMKEPEIYTCVRFSFYYTNTKEEIDYVIDKLIQITGFLRDLTEKRL